MTESETSSMRASLENIKGAAALAVKNPLVPQAVRVVVVGLLVCLDEMQTEIENLKGDQHGS